MVHAEGPRRVISLRSGWTRRSSTAEGAGELQAVDTRAAQATGLDRTRLQCRVDTACVACGRD